MLGSDIREMLPCVECPADRFVIPEDGQLVARFKYGIRMGGCSLAAWVLHQHDQDAGLRAQPGFSQADALVFIRNIPAHHTNMEQRIHNNTTTICVLVATLSTK